MDPRIKLTLLVGPMVPVPVPPAVLDALTDVEVTVGAGPQAHSGFRLNFTVSNRSPLHTLFLVAGGQAPPLIRVIIVVTVGASAEVLIDGVVTQTSVERGNSGSSTLRVDGSDLTVLMDLVDLSGVPYPAMPMPARVVAILAKYAALGVVPAVVPPVINDVPSPVERIHRQKGSDLSYLRMLASDAGWVFYHSAGPRPGQSVAYWGPEVRVGVPQPALNCDMDALTNVTSLTFAYDSENKEMPLVYIQNPETKTLITVPIPPDLSPLSPPLGAFGGMPKQYPKLKGTAKLPWAQAVLCGMVRAARSSDTVKGSGTLDVLRYGRVLKARQLVGVRGAGPAFDGLHFVSKVTHRLTRGEYTQSFELVRNGLVSTLARVPV